MAPVIPDPARIRSFPTAKAFETWLARNHAREPELWLKFHKKASGLPTVTYAEALDIALCWGWIDGIVKSFDERSFLQRFTPRRPRSVWSQVNREHIARLTAAGRMTPHGQRHVDAAKADGRWDAAYAPIRSVTTDTVPEDLRRAIEANPRARKAFQGLNRQNLFALAFRTNNMKTPAGRARKIAELVAMLARGETISPQPAGADKLPKGKATSTSKRLPMPNKPPKPSKPPKSKAATPSPSAASRHIDARIAQLGDWRGEALARVRTLILKADAAIVEEWKWDVPVWSCNGIICTGEVYKNAVKLTFASGARLEDPAGLFNASLEGKTRRAIDVRAGDEPQARAFTALIRRAVKLNSARQATR